MSVQSRQISQRYRSVGKGLAIRITLEDSNSRYKLFLNTVCLSGKEKITLENGI